MWAQEKYTLISSTLNCHLQIVCCVRPTAQYPNIFSLWWCREIENREKQQIWEAEKQTGHLTSFPWNRLLLLTDITKLMLCDFLKIVPHLRILQHDWNKHLRCSRGFTRNKKKKKIAISHFIYEPLCFSVPAIKVCECVCVCVCWTAARLYPVVVFVM